MDHLINARFMKICTPAEVANYVEYNVHFGQKLNNAS